MHGIVHRSLNRYVVERGGEGYWERVRQAVGIDRHLHLAVAEYPDREIADALRTIAEMTDSAESAVQRDFGRYLAPELLSTFDAHVPSDGDALGTLAVFDEVYLYAFDSDGDPEGVDLETYRPEPDAVVLSHRCEHGLCPLLEGVVAGVGEEYGTELIVAGESPDGDELGRREIVARRKA